MRSVADSSVLIDYLRGVSEAVDLLDSRRAQGELHASEVSRLEVLAGMREPEEDATRRLLATLDWHPVDEVISEVAGELGRQWRKGRMGIDSADLAIAATAKILDADLLTLNLKHFPMFPGLKRPYQAPKVAAGASTSTRRR